MLRPVFACPYGQRLALVPRISTKDCVVFGLPPHQLWCVPPPTSSRSPGDLNAFRWVTQAFLATLAVLGVASIGTVRGTARVGSHPACNWECRFLRPLPLRRAAARR